MTASRLKCQYKVVLCKVGLELKMDSSEYILLFLRNVVDVDMTVKMMLHTLFEHLCSLVSLDAGPSTTAWRECYRASIGEERSSWTNNHPAQTALYSFDGVRACSGIDDVYAPSNGSSVV